MKPYPGTTYARAHGLSGTRMVTIPSPMGKLISDDTLFRPEWHPDGILFRRIDEPVVVTDEDVPAWVNGNHA